MSVTVYFTLGGRGVAFFSVPSLWVQSSWKHSQIALMKSVHRVQFKFNNTPLLQELEQENKFGWLISA